MNTLIALMIELFFKLWLITVVSATFVVVAGLLVGLLILANESTTRKKYERER